MGRDRNPALDGSSGLRAIVTLAVGFSIGLGIGCATSDQVLEAQKELDIIQGKPQKAAECKPGIDEPCYGGPEGTAGRGICKEGNRKCSEEGVWGECANEKRPQKETCNRTDDDCDGIVDNGFEREGALCFRGQGACRSKGKWTCAADGTKSECDAPVIAPTEEICDNVDNDCDGEIDEGDVKGTGVECPTGKAGVCKVGTKKCVGGVIRCVAPQPTVEICNNLDDDCDNQVDDDCISADEAKQLKK